MSVIDAPPPVTPEQQPFSLRRWLWTPNPKYTVGTLKYTGFGLMMLFVWLLWGDICYHVLEESLPNVLPLKLKEMGAGDTTNAILKYSFSYTIVFFLAPVVSFRSDRARTRWGRRIPFLFWSAPAMGAFLILIGCYQEITNVLLGHQASMMVLGREITSATMAIVVMGVLIIGSDLAGIFANTTYYYLFNDVVPTNYISRFWSVHRIVATLAGMAYSKWVFPHTMSHFRTIFIVAGIAYTVGFMLMCFFVREGKYPPPPDNVDHRPGIISSIKTYAVECFTHKLYWFFFLSTAFFYLSKVTGMFVLIRNRKSLGLSMEDLGTMAAWTGGISLLLQYPAGWFADKYHPLRVYVFSRIWDMLSLVGACVWLFTDFGPAGNLRYLYFLSIVFMPLGLVANAAELPMYMRILPKDRYGQFCSANAMVRAFVMILFSWAGGAFIGSLAETWGERRYVWLAVWQLFFQVITAVFLILLYRQWMRHGGNTNYVPPGTQPEPLRAFPVLPKT
jgi:hypothetical protein